MQVRCPRPRERVHEPQVCKRVRASVEIVNVWHHVVVLLRGGGAVLLILATGIISTAALGQMRIAAERGARQRGEKHDTEQAQLDHENSHIEHNEGRHAGEHAIANKLGSKASVQHPATAAAAGDAAATGKQRVRHHAVGVYGQQNDQDGPRVKHRGEADACDPGGQEDGLDEAA